MEAKPSEIHLTETFQSVFLGWRGRKLQRGSKSRRQWTLKGASYSIRFDRAVCFGQGSCDRQSFSSEWRAFCQSQQRKGQSSINHFVKEVLGTFLANERNHWGVAMTEAGEMSLRCRARRSAFCDNTRLKQRERELFFCTIPHASKDSKANWTAVFKANLQNALRKKFACVWVVCSWV